MKKFCFYAILIAVFYGCDSSSKKSEIIDYLNNDASVIIKVNNVGSLNSNINNNPFLQQLESSTGYKNLSTKLSLLNHIKTEGDLYISFFTFIIEIT